MPSLPTPRSSWGNASKNEIDVRRQATLPDMRARYVPTPQDYRQYPPSDNGLYTGQTMVDHQGYKRDQDAKNAAIRSFKAQGGGQGILIPERRAASQTARAAANT